MLPTVREGLSPHWIWILSVRAGSLFVITASHKPARWPPLFPPKMASSSRLCSALAPSSTYTRRVPLPRKKFAGHSPVRTALVPLRSTPSEFPSRMSKAKTPAHQPWSGSPSDPSQQGHSILQLHSSRLCPLTFQAIVMTSLPVTLIEPVLTANQLSPRRSLCQ